MAEGFQSCPVFAQLHVATGHAGSRAEMIGVQFEDPLAVGDGFLPFFGLKVQDRALVVGLGKMGALGDQIVEGLAFLAAIARIHKSLKF